MKIIQSIQNRIYEIRDERVMLDFDLAELYEVSTKVLNQAVKRNLKRFPKDFMFRLTLSEWQDIRLQNITAPETANSLRSQSVTSKKNLAPLRFQIETSNSRGGTRYLPYAFTEQGVAMLSGVLHSDKAINMNIAIMRTFVEIRRIILRQNDLKEQLEEIKQRLGGHDIQLNSIYDAMENLLDEKAGQKKWQDRERIGFKK
jgi:hypothetical protein